jgi:PAS domain S-box-containing protein
MKGLLSTEKILDAIEVPLLSTDAFGSIIIANKRASQILGLDEQQVPGASLRDGFPELDHLIKECLRKGERQFGQINFEGGQEFLTVVNPISPEKKVLGTVCHLKPINQPGEPSFEIAKKGINNQLDALIESFYDGVWIVDARGVVLNVNTVALNLHGVKVEEIVGKHITELVKKGIIDRSSTMEVLATKKQVHMLQYLPKGRRHLLVTATPILDQTGEPIQVIVTDRDMTELEGMWERLDHTLGLQGNSQNQLLKRGMEFKGTRVVAASESMEKVLMLAFRLGQLSVSNILLLGESGTGKGMLAKFIHENSPRSSQPFIQVNCAALPESMVEAELFGYEKGAYTGARPKGKIGLLELAQDGTIFLDEIGELPSTTQAKLLKCIDEREIMPLGGLRPRRIRCSIIAATNRDLEALVRRQVFREDLYYRLNSFNITIPPLRERPGDIVELAKNFLFTYNQTYKTEKQLSVNGFEQLQNYSFPGNVRELDNLIKNSIVMSDTSILDEYVQNYIEGQETRGKGHSTEGSRIVDKRLADELNEAEMGVLKEILKRCKSTREMAKCLGTSQATVVRKLRKHGLPPPSKATRSL